MSNEIFFSIITPVYNVENYLKGCIDSVLSQTYENFELILVNDGSTDRSGYICDEYINNDHRIRVFHKKNEGQLATRVFGVQKAQGEYLVFLDSDDSLVKNALQTINQNIIQFNCDCLIYGYNIIKNAEVFPGTKDEIVSPLFIEDKREVYLKIFGGGYSSLCRKAIRANMMSKSTDYSNYYNIVLGEDGLQSLEIYKNIHNCVFISDKIYNYTMNPKSITHSIRFENFTIDFTSRQMDLDFLKESNVFTDEDFHLHRMLCIRGVLIPYIKLIMKFRTSYFNRRNLLDLIMKEKYYVEFLSAGKYNKSTLSMKDRFLLYLFQEKCYFLLCCIGDFLKLIGSFRVG